MLYKECVEYYYYYYYCLNKYFRYNLGPNGGIVTSLNLFATRFDQVGDVTFCLGILNTNHYDN